MGCDVQVEIDKSSTSGTFTNYDLISGVVKLTTTSSISLAYIQVKLEGISTTELTVPKGRQGREKNREKKDKLLQDVHKVLYDSLIVFPPENIRLVSTSKEFTLTPGNYTYPFEFKIPLNNACSKVSGVTNKILINKKFDVVINNGNFNSAVLKNAANNYLQGYTNPNAQNSRQQSKQQSMNQQNYHIQSQLPPSLGNTGDPASVRYFVKVTCKRSSFLKMNLRAFDPFKFLPLDLDAHNQPLVEGRLYEEYREMFYRKDMVFKDRLPEIVGVKPEPIKALPKLPASIPPKRGFILSLFGTPSPPPARNTSTQRGASSGVEVNTTSVPFSFEVRFRYPASVTPLHPPLFQLFFVTDVNPSKYSLAQYGKPDESNGLGVIYLQRLTIELRSTTHISVLETDGATSDIHQAKSEQTFQLCNNTYHNLQFDLKSAKRLKSSSASSTGFVSAGAYELEIPRKYFDNWDIPPHLAPTFATCNINRTYSLSIVAGVSSEQIVDMNNRTEVERKVRYVDLFCPEVKVMSGLKLTSTLHSNASGTSLGRSDRKGSVGPEWQPTLPKRPSVHSVPSEKGSASSAEDVSQLPPTYDDVVRESTFQDNSEHYRARRRYGG